MRLIDADKLPWVDRVILLNKVDGDINITIAKEYTSYVNDETPTVDAEPVRYGHWVRNDNGTYSCSKCHSWIPNEQHYYARYCLHCGAKMDRKGEEDDGI